MEQAALDECKKKLIKHKTDAKLIIAQRGEQERRKLWSRLEAINHALKGGGQRYQERPREKCDMMKQTLRSIGLDKADENELQAAQRSLTQQQQHAAKELGEKLSFTREQWLEEAAYLEDIFLRSIRCSKLRKYVDHDGHVIKRSQNVAKRIMMGMSSKDRKKI